MSYLLIGLAGHEVSRQEREWLQHPCVAGVVLFSRNIESVTQLMALTASIRALCPRALISIDQEGGRVQRIGEPLTRLPPLSVLGQCFPRDREKALMATEAHAWLMATEVLAMGIDISFAPVLDLAGDSSVIGDRAFADDPDMIITLAERYLDTMHDCGMATTGKHFPGHGTVVADTHIDVARDSRSLKQLEQTDLRPFNALMPRLDALMMAHVCYPSVCSSAAGYSPFWVRGYLRSGKQYHGVVFSDDLGMRAAEEAGDYPQRIRASLAAGCDMVMICRESDVETAMKDLYQFPMPEKTVTHNLNASNFPDWEDLRDSSRRSQYQALIADLDQ